MKSPTNALFSELRSSGAGARGGAFARLAAFVVCGAAAASAPAAQALTITAATPADAVSYDFNSGPVPFGEYAPDKGVASGASLTVEDGALKATNVHAGSFGVDLKLKPFDAMRLGHIFFDYRLTPDVKVNIFFRLKGLNPNSPGDDTYFGVAFAGPQRVRPGAVFLGKIDNVAADDKWHRAHLPLRDWLRKLYPTAAQFQVGEVLIGNWDNSNYLMAGIGGNGPGATWRMDNFALTDVVPGEVKVQVNDTPGTPVANPDNYTWSLDGGDETALTSANLTVPATDGFHLLRVRDKAGKQVASYGFYASTNRPRLEAPVLRANTLMVPIASSAGLDGRTLRLSLGGRTFDSQSPYLRWDGAEGTLNLDAAGAGLEWKDGDKLSLEVGGVRDNLGRDLPAKTEALTVDYSKQLIAPNAPEVLLDVENPPAGTTATANHRLAATGTFEESIDEWAPKGPNGIGSPIQDGSAYVERDASTAASGHWSVRLTCPATAMLFGAWVRRTAFDAAKYPVISFDYKVSPQVRTNFYLTTAQGGTYCIGFTDKDQVVQRLGAVPNVVADNQWHHAEIDLLNMLRKVRPGQDTYRVDGIWLTDAGWMGNAHGVQVWFDNFQFVPNVPSPLKATVHLKDVTGTQAISWTLDDKPNTMPPAAPRGSTSIEATGQGRQWLHVRAQNGAGQWSQPLHMPVWFNAPTGKAATTAALPVETSPVARQPGDGTGLRRNKIVE